jgi:type I restriction-modification system DNA methylase subunit
MVDIADQYQTPPEFARYMASLIPAGVETVLEPTPGLGNLVAELDGYDVTAPDDYFLLDRKLQFDLVFMNPPFSAASAILDNAPASYFNEKGMKVGYRMLLDCIEKSDNIIALMPWFTLTDSDKRLRFLKSFGLISITALPRRTFDYARIQTCVLLLKKGYKGNTDFIVYDLLPESPQKNKNQLLIEL